MGDAITPDAHQAELDQLRTQLEERFNRELELQRFNLRLDGVAEEVKGMRRDIREHTTAEKVEMSELLKAIEAGGKERRECEQKVTKRADERHEEYHRLFVKRRDLYIAVSILIAGFTCALWFFTYTGNQANNVAITKAVDQATTRFETIVKGLMK